MEIDYDVSVFIITEYNEYVLPWEYDKKYDGKGVFVCFTNDRLNPEYGFNNSICIHRDWRNKLEKAREEFFKNSKLVYKDNDNYIRCIWQKGFKEIPNNERYNFNKKDQVNFDRYEYLIETLDGYLGCKNIMSNVTPLLKDDIGEQTFTMEEYIPAIMLTYHTKIKFNGQWYNGYLPAIGQLMFMSANILKVDSALNILGVNEKDWFGVDWETKGVLGDWWSSSQYDASYTCALYNGNPNIGYSKNHSIQVLPLFAL